MLLSQLRGTNQLDFVCLGGMLPLRNMIPSSHKDACVMLILTPRCSQLIYLGLGVYPRIWRQIFSKETS